VWGFGFTTHNEVRLRRVRACEEQIADHCTGREPTGPVPKGPSRTQCLQPPLPGPSRTQCLQPPLPGSSHRRTPGPALIAGSATRDALVSAPMSPLLLIDLLLLLLLSLSRGWVALAVASSSPLAALLLHCFE
jgi:hypothetical protein